MSFSQPNIMVRRHCGKRRQSMMKPSTTIHLFLIVIIGGCCRIHGFIIPPSSSSSFLLFPPPRLRLLRHPPTTFGKTPLPTRLHETIDAATTTTDVPRPSTTTTSSSSPTTPPSPHPRPSKLRQLKDMMWVRETLEDLTASEFASSLEADARTTTNVTTSTNLATTTATTTTRSKKRDVDFEKLLNKLNARIAEMCVATPDGVDAVDETKSVVLESTGNDDDEGLCYVLTEGEGMSSVVYANDQREALLERILDTRRRLMRRMEGEVDDAAPKAEGEDGSPLEDVRMKLQDSVALEQQGNKNRGNATTATAAEKTKTKTKEGLNQGDPRLYVREDGSIDWDGALQDRAAVKLFGTAVWSRINGQNPDAMGEEEEEGEEGEGSEKREGEGGNKVTAKIVETEALKEMKGRLDVLKREYGDMKEKHTKLLNSAISPGSTIANINLASLSPQLRFEIRSSESTLSTKKEALTLLTLNYELERIFTYLEGEMGNTDAKGYIPLQDRLNVAEFGLLEQQIDAINQQVAAETTTSSSDASSSSIRQIDADVLAVIVDSVTDFKRRLGIDYYVTGLTFDAEAIAKWLNELWTKTKTGVGFYAKGCKLLWNDCVFATKLIGRAVQGYTLKPREVNTVRRTARDIVTFIPVVIILIIPLSPVGHVLVFGAIQRFFPNFFPSCFTERRQNLLQLYESAEYSDITINETWNEKLVRISEAIVFLTVDYSRRLFNKLFKTTPDNDVNEN